MSINVKSRVNNIYQDKHDTSFYTPSFKSKKKKMKSFSNLKKSQNRRLTELSQEINFESSLISLLKIVLENKTAVQILNGELHVKSDRMDLIKHIRYTFEHLCHIPITFEYDDMANTYVFNFSNLSETIDLITATIQVGD